MRLEEVKIRETDRLATEDEVRAMTDAGALLGNGEDENAAEEVVVKKDVLVEEFTRSETTHEEKVIVRPSLDVLFSDLYVSAYILIKPS